MIEIWKPVLNYENRFLISNHGRLKNVKGKILSQTVIGSGYYSHTTKIGGRNGKSVCLKIHRLVAESFLEPPSEDLVKWSKNTTYEKVYVNHIDGNKLNNNVNNLEWSDARANHLHAMEIGLISKPASGIACKLSYFKDHNVILSIVNRYVPNCPINGIRAISREYGCHHSTISKLISRFSSEAEQSPCKG